MSLIHCAYPVWFGGRDYIDDIIKEANFIRNYKNV